MIRTINLKIDLSHDIVNSGLVFHEGDINGSELKLAIYDNDSAFDLTGCNVKFDAAIGNFGAEINTAATFTGNVITIPITENMTLIHGTLRIDVKIIKNGETLIMRTVSADVRRSVIDDQTVVEVTGENVCALIQSFEDRLTAIEYDIDELLEEVEYGHIS